MKAGNHFPPFKKKKTFAGEFLNSLMTVVRSMYLLWKSMDWLLYDRDLRSERVKGFVAFTLTSCSLIFQGSQ